MSREQELRSGTGHALVVPDASRDNGGAQNTGKIGPVGRGKNRRNDNKGGINSSSTSCTRSSSSSGTHSHRSSGIHSHRSSSSSNSSKPAVGVVVVGGVTGVGAENRSSGGVEAASLAAGEAEEGVGVVVHKQLVVGGETCLRILPAPAVVMDTCISIVRGARI